MKRLVMRWTRWWWNAEIAKVLCRAKSAGVINNQQLHLLTREFDPTQDGYVGRGGAEGRNVACAFEHPAVQIRTRIQMNRVRDGYV